MSDPTSGGSRRRPRRRFPAPLTVLLLAAGMLVLLTSAAATPGSTSDRRTAVSVRRTGIALLTPRTVTSDHLTTRKLTVLLILIAFALTFVLTRLYTRGARVFGWPSGKAGTIHVHHLVVGIITVLLCGLASIGFSPGGYVRDGIAVAFGIGAALTLDEFALWLHLKDVYWTPEGRISIDAILLGALLVTLLLVGTSPLEVGDGVRPGALGIVVVAVDISLALITVSKGKLALGLVAVFIPFVGLVGAVRLAKPGSLWAARLYRTQHGKLERARARYHECSSLQRFRRAATDVIGGAPGVPAPPCSAARPAPSAG